MFVKSLVMALLLGSAWGVDNNWIPCGEAGQGAGGAALPIWGKDANVGWDGNGGACACFGDDPATHKPWPPPAMTTEERASWSCQRPTDSSTLKDEPVYTNGIKLDMSKLSNARSCMSWNTAGRCEFRERDLQEIQFTFESRDCEEGGLWVAPLWISPPGDHWWQPSHPSDSQHLSGEIDILERGCSPDGWLASFGSDVNKYVDRDAWKQKGRPADKGDSSFTGYMSFEYLPKDTIKMYRCKKGAQPIVHGIDALVAKGDCDPPTVRKGHFALTKHMTSDGTEWMRFVTDVWNRCQNKLCSKYLPTSKCKFEVTDIKVELGGEKWKPVVNDPRGWQAALCDWKNFKSTGQLGLGATSGEVNSTTIPDQ